MTDYRLLAKQLESLIQDTTWDISILANASALLWETLPDINWAGFYLMRNGRLELGPFQGKTACIRIPVGSGVCGTAVSEDATRLVYNVHEFPGHIACDSASNSEIVIPIHLPDCTRTAHDSRQTDACDGAQGRIQQDACPDAPGSRQQDACPDAQGRRQQDACPDAQGRRQQDACPDAQGRRIYGVLDIDSPLIGRFTQDDRNGLEEFVRILEYRLEAIQK